MSEHTPEPWAILSGSLETEVGAYQAGLIASFKHTSPEFDTAITHANAARAVTCVNAMAGIADPMAFRAGYESQEEALRKFIHVQQHDLEKLRNISARFSEALVRSNSALQQISANRHNRYESTVTIMADIADEALRPQSS